MDGVGRLDGVLLLAVDAEDLTHDEQVELVVVAAGFVVEGLEGDGRECTLAGQEEVAGFLGEEVVEVGLSEADSGLAFELEGAFPDIEVGGLLTWKATLINFF